MEIAAGPSHCTSHLSGTWKDGVASVFASLKLSTTFSCARAMQAAIAQAIVMAKKSARIKGYLSFCPSLQQWKTARARFPHFSLVTSPGSALIDPHLMEAALKTEYTKEFKLHEKDTGSADVQIALLTYRINDLTKHLQKFKKDHSSRRGLLMMVAQRKKLQDYLKQSDSARYDKVIQKLNLRK